MTSSIKLKRTWVKPNKKTNDRTSAKIWGPSVMTVPVHIMWIVLPCSFMYWLWCVWINDFFHASQSTFFLFSHFELKQIKKNDKLTPYHACISSHNDQRPMIRDHKLLMLRVSLTPITVDVLTLKKMSLTEVGEGGSIYHTEYRGGAG